MGAFTSFMADSAPSFGDFMSKKKEEIPGLKGMDLPGIAAPAPKVEEVPYIDAPAGQKKAIGSETLGMLAGKAGNTWDKITADEQKPIYSLPEPDRAAADAGTSEKIARGVGRSASRNVSSLLTPKNVAIGAGLAALNLTQLTPLAPVTVPLAQTANLTAATYFGAQAASEIPSQIRKYNERVAQGDSEGAAEALTDIGATAAMSAAGAKGVHEGAVRPARKAAGLEPLKPIVNERALTRAKIEEQAEQARAAQQDNPMGVRDVPPSLDAPVPLEGAAPPLPYKTKLLMRRDAKRASEAADAKAVAEALTEPPAPAPNEAGWTPFKSAQDAAQTFKDEGPKSAQESADVFRRQKPEVPETGIPEDVARAQDARERMAEQYAGKPWEALSEAEKAQIDQWRAEGNQGTVAPGQAQGRIRNRIKNQGGFLRISSKKAPPANPVDAYIQQQVATREAARNQGGGWLDKLKAAKRKAETTIVDTTIPLTEMGAVLDPKAAKGQVPFTYKMNSLIDASLKPSSSASQRLHTSGVVDAIRDVADLDALDQLMISRHAADVSARGFKTGRNAAMDQAVIGQKSNEVAIPASKGKPAMTYGQVADNLTKYGDGLLQSAIDSGLISQELGAYLRETYPNYVPLNRIMEAVDAPTGFGGGQVASIGKQTIVQKLHGSEAPIENPLASLIERTLKVESQVARNEAGKYLVKSMTSDPQLKPLMRPMHPGEHVDGSRSITIFQDGQPVRFETTPEIATAAKSLDRAQLGVVANLMLPATRVLKLGTTGLSLPFVFTNIVKDMMHTFVTSNVGAKTALDPRVLTTAAKAATHGLFGYENKTMKTMLEHGGGFTSFDVARGPAVENIADIRAGRSAGTAAKSAILHPVKSFADAFRHTENFLSRSEQFSRARVYEAARRDFLKQGYGAKDAELMAVVESNNSLPNYSRAGSVGRVLNATIPYLNANIQGSRALVRAFKRDPWGTSAKMAALYLAVGTAAQWNLSDPKRREAWTDIEEYDKKHNIVIVPDNPEKDAKGKWKVTKIPMAQGIDELAWPIVRLVEQAAGLNPLKTSEVVKSAIGGLTPIEPGPGVLSSVTPQIIKPTLQAASNFDLHRQIPKVSGALQDLPVEQQQKPWTSQTATALATKVAPAVGLPPLSPIKTEEFARDTFGGLADAGMRFTDWMGGKAGLWKDTGLGGKNPLEAAAARFDEARGGSLSRQTYDVRKEIRDTITNAGVGAIRSLPEFAELDAKGQQHEMNSILSKVNALLRDVETSEEYQAMSDTEKLQTMKSLAKIVKESKPEELLDMID